MQPARITANSQKACHEYTLQGGLKVCDKTLGLVTVQTVPGCYCLDYKTKVVRDGLNCWAFAFPCDTLTLSLKKLDGYIKCKTTYEGKKSIFFFNTDSDPARLFPFKPRPMTIDEAGAIIRQTNLKNVDPAVAVVNQFGVALLGTKYGCEVLYYANPQETSLRNLPLKDSTITPTRKMGLSKDGLVYLDLRNQSQHLNFAPVEYVPLNKGKLP